MLEIVFLGLMVMAFSLFIVGTWRKNDGVIILWISTFIFITLGFSSFDIWTVFCEISTEWSCVTNQIVDPTTGYMMYGLGTISLIVSIYWSITNSLDHKNEP